MTANKNELQNNETTDTTTTFVKGKQTKIVILTILIAAIFPAVLAYLIRRSKTANNQQNESEQKAVAYIKSSLEKGMTLDEIRMKLIEAGWEEQAVAKIIKENSH